MKSIPNAEVLLRIIKIGKSIKKSEQKLRILNVVQEITLNNWQLHYDRCLIKTTIRCRQKQIFYLKTKLFIF